jgi:hypothetical protein
MAAFSGLKRGGLLANDHINDYGRRFLPLGRGFLRRPPALSEIGQRSAYRLVLEGRRLPMFPRFDMF